MARAFRELDGHSAVIAQQVQAIIGNRNDALQSRVEGSRRQLTQQVVRLHRAGGGHGAGLRHLAGAARSSGWRKPSSAWARTGWTSPSTSPARPTCARVGQQLEWLRLRLTELDADKARFLRHVSHELKTPLAVAARGCGGAGRRRGRPAQPGQAEVVTHPAAATPRLLQQPDRDAAALQRGGLRGPAAAPRAHRPAARWSESRSRPSGCAGSRTSWTCASEGRPLVVPVDRDKMASALGNLLSNAIRFSPLGGQVARAC